MKNYTSLLKRFGLFIVIYSVLFWLFSTTFVATLVNDGYRAMAQPILSTVFSKAYLKLERDSPPESDIFTIRAVFTSQKIIEESKQAARQQGAAKVDLKAQEYDLYIHRLFTSFLLFLFSLILITPIGIRQKMIACLIGAVMFFAYSIFKISIFLLDLFNRSSLEIYKLSETGGGLVEGISYVLKSLGTSAFVVVLIWIFTAFRKSNWKEILQNVERA